MRIVSDVKGGSSLQQMNRYPEDDYIQLNGLQHYAYCPRQWALIVLENQWAENTRTVQGQQMHERAHNEEIREKRGDLLTVRGLRIQSRRLGVSGQCDVVEFRRDAGGVPLAKESGLWLPTPVEYKRGKPKEHDADRLQLCCQAMCLEEMLLCPMIDTAYLYYGETARREQVALTQDLRDTVEQCLLQMHTMLRRGHTPKAKPNKGCTACSLREICLPQLSRKHSVSAYIANKLKEDEDAQAE